MQEESFLSAGIDIGTTTTQLVFSKMILKNTSGFGKIPQVKIVSKQVIYKSKVYFTPLLSREEIDGKKVGEIIKNEYRAAGITPEDLSSGAVIITGETSKKRNAKEVLNAISDISGNFVVATAGADLESVLAGKGAGAAQLSKKTGKIVVNLDVGGGTTNIGVFENGNIIDTACLDIGGRLIITDGNKVMYAAPKIKWLANELGLKLTEGQDIQTSQLKTLTDAMAQILAEAVHLCPTGIYLEHMKTNRLLTLKKTPQIITFSGGVADCFCYQNETFSFGDIGVLLAESLQSNAEFKKAEIQKAKETMRATVVGAGNYSMNISGSTILYTVRQFPIKNLPIVKIQMEKEEDIPNIKEHLHKAFQIFEDEKGEKNQVAIAMKGLKCPSFQQIQDIAEQIVEQYKADCSLIPKLVIVLEEDIGKVLGQALYHRIKDKAEILCIDCIHCESGDFIDIGEPIASGNVIPVIVKTLIFGN